jgi:hypothetical protein
VAANTSSVRLLAPASVEYWGLTFSNDSNFIHYVRMSVTNSPPSFTNCLSWAARRAGYR